MATRWMAALAALALLVGACSAGPGNGGQLEGTKWVLDSYAVDGVMTIVPETLYAEIEFGAHRASGFAGCNQYDALVREGGRTLLVGSISSTMMACDEATMAFDQAYLALLHGSRFFGVRRDILRIYDGDTEVLRYDAAPRNPLLGVWRVDSYATDPGTMVAVLPESELEVVFRIGTVGGFAGCNSFSGVYGTNGTIMRVGSLALTRVACDEALMDQETAFVDAFQGASLIETRANQVNLTDRDGSTSVILFRPTLDAATQPVASPATSPSAAASPTAAPSPSPTTAPTATPSPTATPTAAPTAAPTPGPTASASPKPPATPPASYPPAASCDLTTADGATVAEVAYPAAWFTLDAPPQFACRYFDPAAITVPGDGAPPVAAITADALETPYEDALASATDPASWSVEQVTSMEADGVGMSCVTASSLAESSGLPVGSASYACYVDLASAGTVVLGTVMPSVDPAFVSRAAIVALMAQASSYSPGS